MTDTEKLLKAIDNLKSFVFKNRHGLDPQDLISELYKLFETAQEVNN